MKTEITALEIAGVRFRNPVIAASGTFGYGKEYAPFIDVSLLGGICTKGLTLRPKQGNTGERLCETPSGLLNSIGMENPGVEAFISEELPALRRLGPVVIANLGGDSVEDYAEGARLISGSSVDMVELNISCPNVKSGGMAFGLEPETAAVVVRTVRKTCRKPLIVKLSPNAPDINAVAQACVSAGADAVSAVNTFKAMAIDIEKRAPVFKNITAGLSGPAIRPIALRIVWELCKAVPAPVIGIGGIDSPDAALQFLLAGARAVEIGSAVFSRPRAVLEIISGIEEYMRSHKIESVKELSVR
ncbi:MAG: dihydroorotate dehydrogenase [Spirochaetaceae bacterium]|nr:dihydroorotate dehydrogenase [Spirochaetaceae bacterium]